MHYARSSQHPCRSRSNGIHSRRHPTEYFCLTFGPFIATYVIALLLLRATGSASWLLGAHLWANWALSWSPGYPGQAHVSFVNLVLVAGFTVGPRIAALILLSVALVSAYSRRSFCIRKHLVEQDAASQTVACLNLYNRELVIIGMGIFELDWKN